MFLIVNSIVIKRIVADLNIPIDLVFAETLREPHGLAMSSRNVYLSEDSRQRAATIYQSLKAAQHLYDSGERNSSSLISKVKEVSCFLLIDSDILGDFQ